MAIAPGVPGACFLIVFNSVYDFTPGPCKNGDSCVYAHGTSELRKPGGSPVSASKPASGKGLYKTILCTKFVTQG